MDNRVQIRCSNVEKETFEEISRYMGIPLSTWIRLTLRDAARKYAREHGLPDPFADDGEALR